MQDFTQLMDSLTQDEQRFLRGLVYKYARLATPDSPTSSEFAIEQGIGNPQADIAESADAAQEAQNELINKRIIDAQCKFLDPQFQNWIQRDLFNTKFGIQEGTPPAGLQIFPPRDRLDENLLNS